MRADMWRPETRRRIVRALTAAGALAAAVALFTSARAVLMSRRMLGSMERPAAMPDPVTWPDLHEPRTWGTRVFQAPDGRAPAAPAGEAQRFRLAGTFVALGEPDEGEPRSRKAIIDDRENVRQYLLSEGDAVGGMRVVRILPDRVRIVVDGRDLDLHLAYADPAVEGAPVAAAHDPREGPDADGMPTRFGRRLADDQWVLNRSALMSYYHEMLDHPERIIDLYGSFTAVRDDEGGIDGYRVGVGGEQDFFEAVGLDAGDRIVAVNSLRMRSQARAEYFLREFVRDDLDTIVLDVERDGEERRQVYMIR